MVGPAESALDGRIRQPRTVATWGEPPPAGGRTGTAGPTRSVRATCLQYLRVFICDDDMNEHLSDLEFKTCTHASEIRIAIKDFVRKVLV